MRNKSPIYESVVSSRNILLSGRSNESVLNSLESVIINLDSIAIKNIRLIFARCVSEAIKEIWRNNYIGAGFILNLAHNLPLDTESKQNWDVDYFLSVELPTFLEHFDEVSAAREIILCVFSEIAALCGDK